MPKTFISETPYVKIVFHVESYDENTFLQFDANVEQQREVHARYGQFHQLYPHRRGIPVPGTYCERTYTDCSPGPRCFVQSPGNQFHYSPLLRRLERRNRQFLRASPRLTKVIIFAMLLCYHNGRGRSLLNNNADRSLHFDAAFAHQYACIMQPASPKKRKVLIRFAKLMMEKVLLY